MTMRAFRNTLRRLFRVNHGGASSPDSIAPFIRIVKDQPCPVCHAKFPYRPKVHDGEGWWWRCYTEDCVVQYYLPEKKVAIIRGTWERVSYDMLIRRYKVGIFKVRIMDVLDEEVKEFQLKLEAILKEFLEQGRIEVYGNLKIVVTSFDRIDRMALLKGNTIYVNVKARRYPDFVLRYIIAHELAHTLVKKHTWRFWKIVKIIYPEYEKGKEELTKRNRRLRIHK